MPALEKDRNKCLKPYGRPDAHSRVARRNPPGNKSFSLETWFNQHPYKTPLCVKATLSGTAVGVATRLLVGYVCTIPHEWKYWMSKIR
jgi:hypothetical protein